MRTRTACAALGAAFLFMLAPAGALANVDLKLTHTAPPSQLGLHKSVVWAFSVANEGTETAPNVTITQVGSAGLAPFGFAQQTGPTFSLSFNGSDTFTATRAGGLAPGESANFLAGWTGGELGARSLSATATTSATDSDPADNSVTGSFTVVGLVATPADFGSVALGSIGPVQRVTLTNMTNDVDADMEPVRMTGADGDFLPGANPCLPMLPAASSCELPVRFAPSALGPQAATITFPTTTMPLTDASTTLTGIGVAAPTVAGPPGPPGAQGPPGPPAFKLVAEAVSSRLSGRVGRRVVFRYVSTLRADATLVVRRRSKRIARITGTAREGANRIVWNGRRRGKPAPPGRYRLILTLSSGDQLATEAARLMLRR